MIVYMEKRIRVGELRELYKVRSWKLFGLILVFRRYEQLSVRGEHTLPDERN